MLTVYRRRKFRIIIRPLSSIYGRVNELLDEYWCTVEKKERMARRKFICLYCSIDEDLFEDFIETLRKHTEDYDVSLYSEI